MKTALIFVLFGALLGIAAASVVVPPALTWYNEAGYLATPSPGQAGQAAAPAGPTALVNIPSLIHYTTSRLIRGQIVGGVLGAVVGAVIGILVARRRPRVRAAASA
jgi:hypothetical protein